MVWSEEVGLLNIEIERNLIGIKCLSLTIPDSVSRVTHDVVSYEWIGALKLTRSLTEKAQHSRGEMY